jgi:outer membrane protein assembly factor BamA
LKKINIILIIASCLNLLLVDFVFSQNERFDFLIVDNIHITGNKTTKDKIILNELLFKKGEFLDTTIIETIINQSRENLLNKSLFNFVTINYLVISSKLCFFINVEERWYLWPTFMVKYEDRNFNSWLENKDLSRITFGAGIEKYNFRGLNQKIKFKFTVGYLQNLLFTYENLYLDKKHKHSVSVNINFQKQHQISYLTQNNKLLDIKIVNNFAIRKSEILLIYKFRPNLYVTHTVFLKNQSIEISDSVYLLNNNYLGGEKKIRFIHFLYEYEINHKDNNSYPLIGYYFKFSFQKNGVLIGYDDVNLGYIKIQAVKFIKLDKSFYFSSQLNSKLYYPVNQPYFNVQALGYDYFIRGYEYYVINGNLFFLNRNTLKYEVLSEKIINLKFLPFKKFSKIHISSYLTLNFDYGFVRDFSKNNLIYKNNLTNRFLYGFGIGIDFVTYYDKVLRIEYSINDMFEKGLFFHFKSAF